MCLPIKNPSHYHATMCDVMRDCKTAMVILSLDFHNTLERRLNASEPPNYQSDCSRFLKKGCKA